MANCAGKRTFLALLCSRWPFLPPYLNDPPQGEGHVLPLTPMLK